MKKNTIKKLVCVLLLVATLFTMVACAPDDMDYVLVATVPYMVTSNNLGTKTGISSAYYLGIVQVDASGKIFVDYAKETMQDYLTFDGSIKEAAKKGEIKKISTVDIQIFKSATYWRVDTVVTGE